MHQDISKTPFLQAKGKMDEEFQRLLESGKYNGKYLRVDAFGKGQNVRVDFARDENGEIMVFETNYEAHNAAGLEPSAIFVRQINEPAPPGLNFTTTRLPEGLIR